MNNALNGSIVNQPASKPESVPKSQRLISIDAFRGFDMFWITGGTELVASFLLWMIPAIGEILEIQFEHVAWNGFHFYDLIFPTFVFISGLSIPFAIEKRKARGDPKKSILIHILIRTLILWVFGYFYNNINAFTLADIRFFGVLMRIAITYGFAAVMVLYLSKNQQILILYYY